MPEKTIAALRVRVAELESQLEEAQSALEAIRTGQVESLVIEGPNGPAIFSLEGTTYSYRVLVESISEGALTMEGDGVVLYCNARFAQMLRAPLEQVMGNPLWRWIPTRCRPTLEELLRQTADGTGRGELYLRASDGTDLRTHLSISAISDEGRLVYCLVATDLGAQPVEEARAAEAEETNGTIPAPDTDDSQIRTLASVAEQFEKEYLLRILAVAKGKRGRCAELVGISRRSLWLKLRKHGVGGPETGK